MNYKIEKVMCGITSGEVGCGPICGCVVASIKYFDGFKSRWITNVEFVGIPNFYITDTEVFDDFISKGIDCQEFAEFINKFIAQKFGKITLGNYHDIFESFKTSKENDVKLIKSLIWVTRCNNDDLKNVINYLTGKKVKKLEIPILDLEIIGI